MPDSKTPTVLIISYYWPPSSGSGVQRWMYFAKYLNDHGVTPIVLTVDPSKASYRKTDKEFSAFVKEVKAYTTNTMEPLKLYSMLTTGSTSKGIPQGSVGAEKKGLFSKISRYVRGNIFIPDARIGWKRFATKAAKKIITTENIDLIITTGPPHSTHLIGRVLKRKYGIKWIADFRDPWVEIYYNQDLIRSTKSINKDKTLEKSVIDESDCILVTAPSLKELLCSKYAYISTDKIRCITNGYDSDKFNDITTLKDKAVFTITFIGLLTSNMPYLTICKAIKEYKTTNPSAQIRVVLAGDINSSFLTRMSEILGAENVIYHGYVSHKEALQYSKNADLLFSCLPDQKESKIIIPGKLMEYMATTNPILLIGDPLSDAAALLAHQANTKTVLPDNPQEATEFIAESFDNWKNGSIKKSDNSILTTLTRRYKTKQLAELIHTIISKEKSL